MEKKISLESEQAENYGKEPTETKKCIWNAL